jgi:hypothetical protein
MEFRKSLIAAAIAMVAAQASAAPSMMARPGESTPGIDPER